MTIIRLFESPLGTVDARPDGWYARIERGEGVRPSELRAVEADVPILMEQGMAMEQDGGILVPWSEWGLAVENGIAALTELSAHSHLMLEIDRAGDLGRDDFRYIIRWHEGARQVAVERVGPYLRHPATGRLMHLDSRTFRMIEAMDAFNALDARSPDRRHQVWESLSVVHRHAASLGHDVDRHLASNVVVIPPSIGLTIRDDGDGHISFLPRIPDAAVSRAFATQFERSLDVRDVMTLTDQAGRRVRVVLNDGQQEVLRRMQGVRRVGGEVAEQLKKDPAAVFDGVGDAIDLTSIGREYGPRVIGIGPLSPTADAKEPTGGSIFDRMQIERPTEATAPSETPVPAALPRTAVTLDLIDHGTGQSMPVRLAGEDIDALHAAASEAVARGVESIEFHGQRVRVEPALVEALERYRAPAFGGQAADSGVVGQTGHLYLLINEHEDSLTEGLLVTESPDGAIDDEPVQLPAALATGLTLKPHQLDGVQWLATCLQIDGRRGAILADDMGLGKTLQVLTHVARLIETGALLDEPDSGPNGPWRPVLVVAPLLLVETGAWTREMELRFAEGGQVFRPWTVLRDDGLRRVMRADHRRDQLGKPLLDPDRLMAYKVVIATYETLMKYQHSLAQRVRGRPLWSLAVFDEAQEVKSPTTKQTYAAKALDASFKLAATGTPVETRLRDLWNLMDTVEPTRLGTQRDFVTRFERPITNPPSPSARGERLDALRKQLRYQQPGALLLRREKQVLTGLPTRTIHRLNCPLTTVERDTMQGLLDRLAQHKGRAAPLSVLHRLHLASQHPFLAGAAGDLRDITSVVETSGRMQALLNTLREIRDRGEKCLVFARVIAAQRLLADVIGRSLGVPVDIVNGESGAVGNRARSGAFRAQLLHRFQRADGFGVIVLSPFVAGVGLTLTEANHVIHYGRWWNPAIENQATDRVYRIGQTRPVHVYLPIGVDESGAIPRTLDQAVDQLLDERNALAQDFLVPTTDDAAAAALMEQFGKPMASSGTDARPLRDPETVEQAAGVLIAVLERRGATTAWLGADGMHGAQLLATSSDGLTVVRVCDRQSASDAEQLQTAAHRWSRLLARPVIRSFVSSRSLDPSASERDSWCAIAVEARVRGLLDDTRWTSRDAATTVQEVRFQLGLDEQPGEPAGPRSLDD
jgi:hypothetical protein